jgi:hypothetical protein
MLRHAAPSKPRRGWAGFGVGVGEHISARASRIGWTCALAFATPVRFSAPRHGRCEGQGRALLEGAAHFMLRCDIAYVEASARFLDENRAACI